MENKDNIQKLKQPEPADVAKEQKEIANRIQIFSLFQQGLPQREIAERLGVGIATVSRGAKAYTQHNVDRLLPNLTEKF